MNQPLKFPIDQFAPEPGDPVEYFDAGVLRQLCETEHPADLAAEFKDFEPDQAAVIFSRLSPQCCAEVLRYLDYEDRRGIAAKLEDEALGRVIARMSADDRVDLLHSMPDDRSETLLHLLAKKEREDIRWYGPWPLARLSGRTGSEWWERKSASPCASAHAWRLRSLLSAYSGAGRKWR